MLGNATPRRAACSTSSDSASTGASSIDRLDSVEFLMFHKLGERKFGALGLPVATSGVAAPDVGRYARMADSLSRTIGRRVRVRAV
jgi:hypothetical protein